MSQCLYAYNNPNYDDVVASGWQAAQVSTISIMNFSGRIFIGKYCSNSSHPCTLISVCTGLVSDFTKNKYGMPRSYCLVLVAVMFFVSQVAAGSVNDVTHLWIASALLGLAYGSIASLFPTVCLEWFGMRKC
jgi:MFS family permease